MHSMSLGLESLDLDIQYTHHISTEISLSTHGFAVHSMFDASIPEIRQVVRIIDNF